MLGSNVTDSLPRRRRRRTGTSLRLRIRRDDGCAPTTATTDITGPIIDQSHLHGLLGRIASLGLTLHSLTPLETENAQTDAQPHTQPAGIDHHNPGANSKGP